MATDNRQPGSAPPTPSPRLRPGPAKTPGRTAAPPAAAGAVARPLGDELREQARVVGQRLRESMDGQVTGRVVRGVSRLIRHLGGREAGADTEAAAAPAPDLPAATTLPAEPAARPWNEEALLAQFQQRRQARAQRCSHRLQERRVRAALTELAVPAAPTNDAQDAASPPPPEPPVAPVPTPLPSTAGLPSPPGDYVLPPLDLLAALDTVAPADPGEIEHQRHIIQDTLDSFGIDAEVGRATRGPRVTLYEVTVSRGVKVEAISHIANNLAMELAALSLRILAPVPGQEYVGIEVPNREPDTVRIGSLLRGDLWARTHAELPLMMGRNIHGADVILDLAKAPHVLVAGATGSGKSVCLNALILSLLYRFSPAQLRLLMVDPKIVEFSVYKALPHLIVPVISEVSTVVLALRWLLHEMEWRYQVFARVGARNLQGFNHRSGAAAAAVAEDGTPLPERLPYIVLIIDELADIMMTARQDVETSLARIAQMSRAVGIHTVIATQRPSVNVITGIIKANYPTRVAFQVASQVDSRTIIDGKGAESLLGRGDMLFKPPGAARLLRLQTPMVEDTDIEAVAAFASAQGPGQGDFGILKVAGDESGALESGSAGDEALDEALVQQAMEIVVRDRRASTSYLQRRLRLGYNRAAAIIDCLEQRGVIGPSLGSGPREILVDGSGANDQ